MSTPDPILALVRRYREAALSPDAQGATAGNPIPLPGIVATAQRQPLPRFGSMGERSPFDAGDNPLASRMGQLIVGREHTPATADPGPQIESFYNSPYVQDTVIPLLGGSSPSSFSVEASDPGPVERGVLRLAGYEAPESRAASTSIFPGHGVTIDPRRVTTPHSIERMVTHEMAHVGQLNGTTPPYLDQIAERNYPRITYGSQQAPNRYEGGANLAEKALELIRRYNRILSAQGDAPSDDDFPGDFDRDLGFREAWGSPGITETARYFLRTPTLSGTPLGKDFQTRYVYPQIGLSPVGTP